MLPARSGWRSRMDQADAAMVAASHRAIKAAEAHDKEGLFNTRRHLRVCVNCHKRFDPAITSVK